MTSQIIKYRRGISAGAMATLCLVMMILFLLGKLDINSWFMTTSRDAGFVLEDLKVSGLQRTQENAILAKLDIDDGMPLFAIELTEIQNRIIALPWVKSATVVRKLPGTLEINLTEREPFARWQRDGVMTIVDENGIEIPGQNIADFANLPWIVGAGAEFEAAGLYDILALNPDLTARIKQAVWIGGRRWDVIFENGIRVKLPEVNDPDMSAEDAWARFSTIQATHNILAREVNVVDMRLKDRVIFRVTPEGSKSMEGKEWLL
jgi:cell division protein FtsQ